MSLQFILSERTFRNEIIKDLENSSLDPEYLQLLRENDDVYRTFQDFFRQLKGTTKDRVSFINEVINYLRDQLI